MQCMPGIARKLSLPVLVVAMLGWILYIIAFGVVNNGTNYKTGLVFEPPFANCANISNLAIPTQRASLYWFPHWIVVIGGPFLFVSTLLHVIFAKWFTGIPSLFLTSLYLVCGGAVVYTWAVELFDSSALIAVQRYCPPQGWLTNTQWGLWPLIEWVGALSSVVFLTCYMMMWACFSDPEPVYYGEEGEYYEEDEEQAEGGEEPGEGGEEPGEGGEEQGDKEGPQETTIEN